MTMVLLNKSKSPIHHVREGGVNGSRGGKLIRIPSARQGRALLSTTTNIKRRQSKAPAQHTPAFDTTGGARLFMTKPAVVSNVH